VQVIETFEASNFVKSIETNLARVYKVVQMNRPYLDYYKNNVIHLFLQISFISSILNAHEGDRLSVADLNTEIDSLKSLFANEFIFADQFWNEKTYNEALRYLSVVREIKINDNQIELSKRHHVWIDINRYTITNFFEAYYSFFDYILNQMSNNEKLSEKDLLKEVLKYAWDLFEISIIQKPESISKDIYRNVLKYAIENELMIMSEKEYLLNMHKLEEAKLIRKKLFEYIHS
ncbi:MAG: hypothetical protein KDD94_13170, partial [Calditrichaeota bacterium]|nr:hypothetical protein [Calditrichota bacterium]